MHLMEQWCLLIIRRPTQVTLLVNGSLTHQPVTLYHSPSMTSDWNTTQTARPEIMLNFAIIILQVSRIYSHIYSLQYWHVLTEPAMCVELYIYITILARAH